MPKRHRPGVSAPSVLRHVEEVVLATSGEDTFEIVFSVAAARMLATPRRGLRTAIKEAQRKFPTLEVDSVEGASDELIARVDALLADHVAANANTANGSTLDAVFESLVPRVAKSDKGQFFTPRHVVDFMIRMLAPSKGEVVVDPSCGSGAFLSQARSFTKSVSTWGCDVDARAVRVARLLSLAMNGNPNSIARGDGLHSSALAHGSADVIATNPPFAGRAPADGFEIAKLVRAPERDVLFLDRAMTLLKPGGRLGIVLPYNKASGVSFRRVRAWLIDHARVLAIIGLPRETFLPHTSQRTFVLLAQKRDTKSKSESERTMFIVSERAGKDSGGDPIFKKEKPQELDHDLNEVAKALEPFLRKEHFGR